MKTSLVLDKLGCYLLFILFLSLPLVYTSHFVFPFRTSKEVYFEIILYFITLIFFIRVFISNEISVNVNLLDKLIILRLVYIGFAGFLIDSFTLTIKELLPLIFITIFFFLVKHFIRTNKTSIMWIFVFISISALVESLVVIKQFYFSYLLVNSFAKGVPGLLKLSIAGTMGNPNSVGSFLAVSYLYTLFVQHAVSNKFMRFLFSTISILILIALFLSMSRGAWLAFSAGIVYYYHNKLAVILKKIHGKLYKTVIAIVMLIVLISGIYSIIALNPKSAEGRLFIWDVTISIIADNPLFGTGYNTYSANYINYQEKYFSNGKHDEMKYYADDIKQTHNEYLQIASETGIAGLIIFLAVIITYFHLSRKSLNIEKKDNLLIKITSAGTLVILVHSIFDNPLHVLPVYVFFYLNLGLISTSYDSFEEKR